MHCNYNSFIQIINFHGLLRNAPRCRKTGACRILVPLRYSSYIKLLLKKLPKEIFCFLRVLETGKYLGNNVVKILIEGNQKLSAL